MWVIYIVRMVIIRDLHIKFFNDLMNIKGFSSQSPKVILAQFDEMLIRVPVMYLIVLINCFSLAYTHYGIAPNYLTVHLPLIFLTIAISRMISLYKLKLRHSSLEESERYLKKSTLLTNIMAVVFLLWGYALYRYGDFALQAHVVYFFSITVIGIIVCLSHIPIAAKSISATVGIPFVLFFSFSDETTFAAIAGSFLIIIAVLNMITASYYRAFSNLIDTKQELEEQHENTQKLNIQNERLANLDVLTNLENRRSFTHELTQKLRNSQNSFIVGLIDLDGFKPVNDIHGHAAGDRVLSEASARLTKIMPAQGVLARIGGDEFALIVDNNIEGSDIHLLGKRITEALQVPFVMRTGVVQISGSCGFAIYPQAGNTVDALMDSADFALYEAKNTAKGSTIIFTKEHECLIRQKSKLELALTTCISNNEISLHFQPIVNGVTGDIVGLEALARWFNPELGQVPPDKFIPLAEQNGIITDITLFLFEQACEQLKTWPEALFLSFHLSAHNVINRHTLEQLQLITHKHGIAPHRVQFEITENIMMKDLKLCSAFAQELQEQGFKIALDDFGSGSSSLSYLHQLAFNTLKIDRNFIHNLQDNHRSQGVVRSILALCSSLNVNSTVEGVETEEQKELLLALGCKNMQGYYFYRPASIEEFKLG
ncbi:EAL domain-containing protein [Marinomonas sp.]|nr:EAL domain-containing protein [Marinomonas sp.]MDB4837966.1 EAL domain-containing protein [Marinomonas sp.]